MELVTGYTDLIFTKKDESWLITKILYKNQIGCQVPI